MTLVGFLTARLAEDEQVARATIDVNVLARVRRGVAKIPRWLPEPDASGIWDETGTRRVGHTWVREREHIVRHDPARVLADIEAKRRIVDEHRIVMDTVTTEGDLAHAPGCQTCHEHDGEILAFGYCRTLRLLALPYADHDDYREEWRL